MNILLTGAGFTKNFGGFLADEMWAMIFNHPAVQTQSKVRKLMLDNYDYESIYHTIINSPQDGEYDEDDRTAIRTAVSNAYQRLDDKILAWKRRTCTVDIGNVTKLVKNFAIDRSSTSYFFTLNQDLLVERFLDRTTFLKPFNLPGGIPLKPTLTTERESPLRNEDFIALPNEERVSKLKTTPLPTNEFFYIKLHGSYNWKSYRGHDMMVIGLEKEEAIIKEPLLKWYYKIFRAALTQDGVRLFVIGYGFRDEHINKVIAKAIIENSLQLYVLSPQKPSQFMNSLYSPGVIKGHEIYEGLYGYYPYDLAQVFPADGQDTEEYMMIKASFFS